MASIGFNIPQLPVAGTWAAPFTIYYIILTVGVSRQRVKYQVPLGPAPNPASGKDDSATKPSRNLIHHPLDAALRSQQNFLENVPMAYILLAISELNGGNEKYLNFAAGVLLSARVAHAHLGLMRKGKYAGNAVGRPAGFLATVIVLFGLGAYNAWLVKGYLGF